MPLGNKLQNTFYCVWCAFNPNVKLLGSQTDIIIIDLTWDITKFYKIDQNSYAPLHSHNKNKDPCLFLSWVLWSQMLGLPYNN